MPGTFGDRIAFGLVAAIVGPVLPGVARAARLDGQRKTVRSASRWKPTADARVARAARDWPDRATRRTPLTWRCADPHPYACIGAARVRLAGVGSCRPRPAP